MSTNRANPNDLIRDQILHYFYDRNQGATSRFGKKGSAVRISDVKRELKANHGLSQQQVMANLTYLIDRGWIHTVNQEKSINTTRGTTIPSVVTFYEISAEGIDSVEGGSAFQPKERFPGVNIQATGSNVITLGDGNLVNAKYATAAAPLAELRAGLLGSSALDDGSRLSAAADIDTITSQLAKPEPDASVIGRAWPRIAMAADVAGLTALALQVGTMLAPLLAH